MKAIGDSPAEGIHVEAVWLAKELLAEGWSPRSISRARRAGVIHRVRPGAYVDAGLWQRADELDRHRLRARAVLKKAHPSSVLSHYSALAELRVPLWGADLQRVHLTRLDGQPRRAEVGVVHHCGRLLDHEVLRSDIPFVVPARAGFEATTVLGVESALAAVNGLLHVGYATLSELEAYAAVGRRWPNSLTTTMVMRLADARMQSPAESRFVYLCYRLHLPRPEPQVSVLDQSGFLLGVVDFLWRQFGVFLEFDGRIKYDLYRRPGEDLAAYVMREKRREERICQATGWVCIRIGWADLEHPEATARRIRDLIASRRGWADQIRGTG